MEVPEERRNIFLTAEQLNLLAGEKDIAWKLPAFRTKLSACGLSPLKPTTIDIIQKQFPSESTLSLPGNDEPRNNDTQDFNLNALSTREIVVHQHSYGRTSQYRFRG